MALHRLTSATIGVDEDEKLLRRAETALTEIKVAHGLSEQHAAVLAALRIRLKGKADASLEEMIEAADDTEDKPAELACMSVPANGVFFDVAGPWGENASARTG